VCAKDAPKVVVARPGGYARIDICDRRRWAGTRKQRQAGLRQTRRSHRNGARKDHEVARNATYSPRRAINALVTRKARRGSVRVLRKLTIGVIPGRHAAAESAPSPEAEARRAGRARSHASAGEGRLPVLPAISKCWTRHRNGEQYGKPEAENGSL